MGRWRVVEGSEGMKWRVDRIGYEEKELGEGRKGGKKG